MPDRWAPAALAFALAVVAAIRAAPLVLAEAALRERMAARRGFFTSGTFCARVREIVDGVAAA